MNSSTSCLVKKLLWEEWCLDSFGSVWILSSLLAGHLTIVCILVRTASFSKFWGNQPYFRNKWYLMWRSCLILLVAVQRNCRATYLLGLLPLLIAMWFFFQLGSLKLHYCKIVANRQASGRKPEKAFNWENDPIVHAKLLWQPCKLVQMMMAPSRLHSPGFVKSGPTAHKNFHFSSQQILHKDNGT